MTINGFVAQKVTEGCKIDSYGQEPGYAWCDYTTPDGRSHYASFDTEKTDTPYEHIIFPNDEERVING